jgi:hypothetical protein
MRASECAYLCWLAIHSDLHVVQAGCEFYSQQTECKLYNQPENQKNMSLKCFLNYNIVHIYLYKRVLLQKKKVLKF